MVPKSQLSAIRRFSAMYFATIQLAAVERAETFCNLMAFGIKELGFHDFVVLQNIWLLGRYSLLIEALASAEPKSET